MLAVAAVQAVVSSSSSSSPGASSSPVKARLRGAYGYVAAGVAGTAGAALLLFRGGAAQRLMAVNPIVLGIGSVAVMMGTMYATRATDYYER